MTKKYTLDQYLKNLETRSVESDDLKIIPIITRSILEYQQAGTSEQLDELLSEDPPFGMLMLVRDMAKDEATKIIMDLWLKGFIVLPQFIEKQSVLLDVPQQPKKDQS